MLLALRGKIVRVPPPSAPLTPWGELAEALSKAEAALPPGLKGAEKEQYLFREAIVILSR
jgi:hypothetical protein